MLELVVSPFTVTYIVSMLPAVDMPADFISGLAKQLLMALS